MTEKFKVGQRVIAVEETKNLRIGDKGIMLGTYDDNMVNIKLDNDSVQRPWYPFRFQTIDEYPMNYTVALHAMIDGKTVEDEDGVLVKFIAPHFYCKHSSDTEFVYSHYVFTHSKFKEYVATPKFKRGDFVEYDDEYARIFKVNDDGTYDITMQPSRYASSDVVIQGKSEEELKEV